MVLPFLPATLGLLPVPSEGGQPEPNSAVVTPAKEETAGTEASIQRSYHFARVEPYEVKLNRIQTVLNGFRMGLSASEKEKLARLIYEESVKYHYDPELILGLIATESSFYNWSRSRVGAIGLMQIMPATGISLAKARNINWMGNATLFDPYLNIKLGVKYLAMMHGEFDDLEIALTAYNYGPTRVRGMIESCQRLPKRYARKVLSNYKKFLQIRPAGMPVDS